MIPYIKNIHRYSRTVMAFASFLSRGSMRMYARYAYRYQYEPDRRLVYSVVRKYPTENVCVPCRRQVYRYEISQFVQEV